MSGDTFSRRTELYEVEVTVVNVANRSNDLSQTHIICKLGVCLSTVIDGKCACSTQQLHLKHRP